MQALDGQTVKTHAQTQLVRRGAWTCAMGRQQDNRRQKTREFEQRQLTRIAELKQVISLRHAKTQNDNLATTFKALTTGHSSLHE